MAALASKDENGHVRVNPAWNRASADQAFKLADDAKDKRPTPARMVAAGNNHSEGIGCA